MFAFSFFLGQAGGTAACGLAVDALGYRPVFAVIAVALLALGLVFARIVARTQAEPA